MGFARDGSDRIRAIGYLGIDPFRLEEVGNKMKFLERQSSDLVDMAITLLNQLDEIESSLASEMQSNQGALVQAGPLRWSEKRFIPILIQKRNKIIQLGRILSTQPDLFAIDQILQMYGIGNTIIGLKSRN